MTLNGSPSPAEQALADATSQLAEESVRTILCVDDESAILAALKRTLRAPSRRVLTASGPAEALQILAAWPVDVVISDMRMPAMDGAQLLGQVRDRWPETVRILLTGHADHAATIAAINQGGIFRYLQKPWEEAELIGAVQDGLLVAEQQRARAAWRDLAESRSAELQRVGDELQSLQAQAVKDRHATDIARQRFFLQTVKVLSTLMERRSPLLFAHGQRVASLARDIARHMGQPDELVLNLFVAGLLHGIGLLGVPEGRLAQLLAPAEPDASLDRVWHDQVRDAVLILSPMDEMAPVIDLIGGPLEPLGGAAAPDATSLGARILAVACAVAGGGGDMDDAVVAARLREASHRLDRAVVEATMQMLGKGRA